MYMDLNIYIHIHGCAPYVAVYLPFQIEVAIKTLNSDTMSSTKENFLKEAHIMVQLRHDCIVRLIGVCMGPPIMLV